MPCVKAKTKSGSVMDFNFDEIVSIDGIAYCGMADPLGERVASLEGRVATIEHIFLKAEEDMAARTLAGVET